MAEHTPGPWKVCGFMVSSGTVSQEESLMAGLWYTIAQADDDGQRVRDKIAFVREEHEANAHLIAAAPDLLDACIYVLNKLELSPLSTKVLTMQSQEFLRTVIARALGAGEGERR